MKREATLGAPLRAPLIYRQFSLTLPAFAALKAWQGRLQAEDGRRVTNSEALSRLILSCPALTDSPQ